MKKVVNLNKQNVIKWLRYTGIGLVSIIVLYFIMDLIVMPVYTRQFFTLRVPNVTHLSYDAAYKILTKSGLKVVKGGEKYDENYPSGFVLFQNPGPDSHVKKGRRVYLIVGKGHRVFKMPKLVGMALRDVKFKLKDLQLLLGHVEYENDFYYPEGVVSSLSIEEDTEVAVGERIDVTVSLGAEPTVFIVPDLLGKSVGDALLAVKKAGLTLGSFRRQETDKLIPNTVIKQSLDVGLQVSKGDTIDLYISQLPNKNFQEESKW